ncbi:MAG: SDR family oxidoreductase [Rubrivivax sp.]|nr:SDR family oxidoreductase [Rubrivivax sp.]
MRARRTLAGAVVVVTGAASGLGAALARHAARHGAQVAALDVDSGGLAALAAQLAAPGHEVLALPCDVTDRAACEAAVARAVAQFGRIDWLFANAGISHHSALAHTAPEVIRRVVEVNFFGAVHITQAALPHLLARGGALVAVSSVAGFSPLLARTGYAASKHALHGFFDSLRPEVAAAGLTVTLACPSFVDTAIDRHALDGRGHAGRHSARVVVGRPLAAADVARRICEAAARGRARVLIGRTAHLAWWLSRLTPDVYEALMARRMRAEIESVSTPAPPPNPPPAA